ncbi:MAG: N-acetyl sugar amidotransferase [Sphingomonas hengshuiensis]|uniref:N-acetyl sugar amidotransferase n=2 Tax=Sphingomonas TaxID=13687 RepID=A0A2W4Z9T6_9SPHN|nr:MAG: N-acetyl sugar amidotransferase [Sphingomonas hengshuiensis]
MDSSMPGTTFDAAGICNNCRDFDAAAPVTWFPNEEGQRRLEVMVDTIKRRGEGQEYDCIFGLSGGVDSSYLALKLKEWGLRPLVVHVDAGWNTELAVQNIQAVLDYCGFDLCTEVVNWKTMKDLQAAYFRSGVFNQDVPQDHVFMATLFHYAKKFKIKSIISGHNFATESVPMRWQHNAMDRMNLKSIHRKHGKRKLAGYRTISFVDYYFTIPVIDKIKFYRPLNLMPYDKEKAIEELETVGWKRYARKHGESEFTKFFQDYYLPVKFGIDKRRTHLSGIIMSGMLTRDAALALLQQPTFDEDGVHRDIEYFCKKIGVDKSEFDHIMERPAHRHEDYATWKPLMASLSWMKRIIRVSPLG